MAELARSEPGIAVPASEWDSRGDLLAVGNGVLELARDGARLRALLARARGDDEASRDLVSRYRAMAESLGFEGHIAWAEAMIE